MKILLDNCMPKRFRRLLAGHEVTHTSELGWGDLKNGKLLAAAEDAGFDALVTVDSSLQFQQSLSRRKIAIILIRAFSNDLPTLTPLASQVLKMLSQVKPGTVTIVQRQL